MTFYITLERPEDLEHLIQAKIETYADAPENLETVQNAHVLAVTVQTLAEFRAAGEAFQRAEEELAEEKNDLIALQRKFQQVEVVARSLLNRLEDVLEDTPAPVNTLAMLRAEADIAKAKEALLASPHWMPLKGTQK